MNEASLSPEDEGSENGEPDAPETRECFVSAELDRQRIDKVLVAMAGEFSRGHLQSLIDEGCVQLDGHTVGAASKKVSAGQQVRVELRPTQESRAFRPEPIALRIVHEDEHLMVVDKPAGLVVHPAPGNWSGTLLNGLLAHHAAASTLPRAGIVHRLDKDTSGLMVVGKTLQAVTALVRVIAAREVHREYVAIVHGAVVPQAFSAESPIGRDPQSRVRMAITPQGRPARTDVEVVATASFDAPGSDRTLVVSAVRCRLHTGRTHQIRVHLAGRRHPLVADALYGGAPLLDLTRQALHAVRLGFVHPVSGETLHLHAPPPADFDRAWQAVAPGIAP